MSDRIKGLVVTFEGNFSEEDAENLRNAISHLRGVLSVDPVPTKNIDDFMVATKVRTMLQDKVLGVFRECN